MFLALVCFENLVSVIFGIQTFDDVVICDAVNKSYVFEDLLGVRFYSDIDFNSLKMLVAVADAAAQGAYAVWTNWSTRKRFIPKRILLVIELFDRFKRSVFKYTTLQNINVFYVCLIHFLEILNFNLIFGPISQHCLYKSLF